jgi:hypothetical protein
MELAPPPESGPVAEPGCPAVGKLSGLGIALAACRRPVAFPKHQKIWLDNDQGCHHHHHHHYHHHHLGGLALQAKLRSSTIPQLPAMASQAAAAAEAAAQQIPRRFGTKQIFLYDPTLSHLLTLSSPLSPPMLGMKFRLGPHAETC